MHGMIHTGYFIEFSNPGALAVLSNCMGKITLERKIPPWCHVSVLSQNCHRTTRNITIPFCMKGILWWGCPCRISLFSQLQWLFWKLTFKLSGNSANFCFAFRSCCVSSGSVTGCFTSSLLSREEQVSWVTVFLADCVASLLDKEHRRELAKYFMLEHLGQSPKSMFNKGRELLDHP